MKIRDIYNDRIGVLGAVLAWSESLNLRLIPLDNGEWLGKCPKCHSEEPYFHVHPDKHLYECKGCGVRGDTLDFVTDVAEMGMIDGRRWLDEYFNVPSRDIQNEALYIGPLLKSLRHTRNEGGKFFLAQKTLKTMLGHVSEAYREVVIPKIAAASNFPEEEVRRMLAQILNPGTNQ
jgi:hypothetical protein